MLGSQFKTPLVEEENKEELEVVSVTRKVTVNDDLLPYPTEATLFKHLPNHSEEVLSCTVFGNGTLVATTSTDGYVRIFDIEEVGKAIHVLNFGCRVLTAIGQNSLAVFCKDSELKTYSVHRKWRKSVVTEQATIQIDTFGTSIVRLGDSSIALGNSFGDLLFYTHNKGSNLKYVAYIRAHTGSIHCMDVRGNNLLTASTDKSATIWDWSTKQRLKTFQVEEQITSVAINERYIFVATMANDLLIWNNEAPEYRCRAHLRNLHINQPVLAILPIGTDLLVTADKVGDLIYTRLSTHKLVALDEVLSCGKINDLALTNTGSIVTVGCASENDEGFAAIVDPPTLVNTMVKAQAYRLYPKGSEDEIHIYSPEPEDVDVTPPNQRKRALSNSTFSFNSRVKSPRKSLRAQRPRRSILHDSMRTVSTSKAPRQRNDSSRISFETRSFTEYVPPAHVRQQAAANMSKAPRRSTRNKSDVGKSVFDLSNDDDGVVNVDDDDDLQLIDEILSHAPLQDEQPTPQINNSPENNISPLHDNTPPPQLNSPANNNRQPSQSNRPSPHSPNAQQQQQQSLNAQSSNAQVQIQPNRNTSSQSVIQPNNTNHDTQSKQTHRVASSSNATKPHLFNHHDNAPFASPQSNNVYSPIVPQARNGKPPTEQSSVRRRRKRKPRHSRRNFSPKSEANRSNQVRSVQSRSARSPHRERYSSRRRSRSPPREPRRFRSLSPRRDSRRSPSPRRPRFYRREESRRRDPSPPSSRYVDDRRRSFSRERRQRYRSRSPPRRHRSSAYRRSRSPVRRRRHSSPPGRETRIEWSAPRAAMHAMGLPRASEPIRFEVRCILPPHLAHSDRDAQRNYRSRHDSRGRSERRR